MAFSSTLIKIFIISVFLRYNNVHSQYSQSPQAPQAPQFESVAFTLTRFDVENPDIFLQADASISGGVLRLTKTDQYELNKHHASEYRLFN
ncbi:hypothetical protein RYX36_007348 [Vicia faba]